MNEEPTNDAAIAHICELVAKYFKGDGEKIALWFTTENPFLGGISPIEMIKAGKAARLYKIMQTVSEGAAP